MTRLVLISDTHNGHEALKIPPCDVLIHAGDATNFGDVHELERFSAWCRSLKKRGVAREVIFSGGNHDRLLDASFANDPNCTKKRGLHERALESLSGIHFSPDRELNVLGVRFWTSPWSPCWQPGRFAFQADEGAAENYKEKGVVHPSSVKPHERVLGWVLASVPRAHPKRFPRRFKRQLRWPSELYAFPSVDVLVTHTPAHGILDRYGGERLGSKALLAAIDLNPPKVHVCGHIHEGRGVSTRAHARMFSTHVNASTCDGEQRPVNEPYIYDLGAT